MIEALQAEPLLGILIVVAVLILGVVLVGVLRRSGRDGSPPAAPPSDPDGDVRVIELDTDAQDGGGRGVALDEPGEAPLDGVTAPDDLRDLEEFEEELPEVPDTPAALVEELEEPLALGERFRRRLSRTRNVLGASVAELFGRGIDEDAWEGLEEALITADVGVAATMEIVEEVRRRSREEGATTADAVLDLLKQELRRVLGTTDRTLARASDDGPTVWLITGVNGTGKTTSIGKLAALEQREDRDVVVAAADTFRAAAAEQLGIWAQRTGAELVRKEEGADPASVAYEAYDAAASRAADLLIVDTAGRLQNKRELMDELGKVKRVLEKRAGPLEEVLLVLDATTGQNGISQARAFLEAVDVTGIILTKLDGSSKGGIVIAVQKELGLPVKLVGLGEGIDDLATFDPELFVEGLFADASE